MRPQNPSAGVPAGNQVLGCLLQCPKIPHNYYGTLPWGPQGTLVRQNPTCKIFTVFQPSLPCRPAETSMGPSCATPKAVCGGPCGQPSAWMPPTVSQDATQSVWGPTMGSPGHPGSSKIEKPAKFTDFGVPEKNRRKPQKRRKSQKNRNSAKMRPFHQPFLPRTIWPIYSG